MACFQCEVPSRSSRIRKKDRRRECGADEMDSGTRSGSTEAFDCGIERGNESRLCAQRRRTSLETNQVYNRGVAQSDCQSGSGRQRRGIYKGSTDTSKLVETP